MKGMNVLFVVMIVSLGIAFLWDQIPIMKESVHATLDPTVGKMLDWNLSMGFIIVVGIFTLLTSLMQKFFTDQKTLKELKDEQKLLQQETKKYKDNPEKIMELNKKSMEIVFKTLPLTMRPVMFTSIPFILFFRWFTDFFSSPEGHRKLLLFFSPTGASWIWPYLIVSIIFSSIFRKMLKIH